MLTFVVSGVEQIERHSSAAECCVLARSRRDIQPDICQSVVRRTAELFEKTMRLADAADTSSNGPKDVAPRRVAAARLSASGTSI